MTSTSTWAKREIVAMGRNGMGKTTLQKLDGHPAAMGRADQCRRLETHQRVASGIAYVPQGRMIFPSMSVLKISRPASLPGSARAAPEDLYALEQQFDMRAQVAATSPAVSNNSWRLPAP